MTPEWRRLPCAIPDDIETPVALRCRVICRCEARGHLVTLIAQRTSGCWWFACEHEVEILSFLVMPVPPDMVQ